MSTPNLGLAHIAASQNQKEVTANADLDGLDLALTNPTTINLTDAPYVMTAAIANGNMAFTFTGALTANRLITLPSKKVYVVWNETTGGQTLTFGTTLVGRTAQVAPLSSPAYYTVLYCDGTNVDVVSDRPFDISLYAPGVPTAGQTLLRFNFTRYVLFPNGLTSSQGSVDVAATSPVTATIKKNGSSIGTVNITSSTVTFTFSNSVLFAPGDVMTIIAPNPADATLAGLAVTLLGLRI